MTVAQHCDLGAPVKYYISGDVLHGSNSHIHNPFSATSILTISFRYHDRNVSPSPELTRNLDCESSHSARTQWTVRHSIFPDATHRPVPTGSVRYRARQIAFPTSRGVVILPGRAEGRLHRLHYSVYAERYSCLLRPTVRSIRHPSRDLRLLAIDKLQRSRSSQPEESAISGCFVLSWTRQFAPDI